ncbi:MAG TPA: hypothetical protein VN516_06955, partial [Candidatus Baltobacteraceae bacterium]|nr:hypothetical protein [Candidatus Baltobacteraceae bacterium]
MSRRLKILVVISVVLCVTILISVVHHFQLRNATNAYIAELKAKGELLDLAQVIPPPVPSEQNGAPLITNALYKIDLPGVYANSLLLTNPPSDIAIAPAKVQPRWQLPIIHSGDRYPTNSWEDLEAQLAEQKS